MKLVNAGQLVYKKTVKMFNYFSSCCLVQGHNTGAPNKI